MKEILFNLQARFGDIIAGSMIANMLIDQGIVIYWLVHPYYVGLVERVCPDAIIIGGSKYIVNETWGDAWTDALKKDFDGMEVLNAQFGATENHDVYMGCGMSPLNWLRKKIKDQFGISLPENYRDYLKFEGLNKSYPVEQPYAIIAPDSHARGSMDLELIDSIFHKFDKKYRVKILVKKNIQYENQYALEGYSFIECISIIYGASCFAGLDSGLAWASLISDCSKEIYHNKKRLDLTNNYFSNLDLNAKDFIHGA